MDSCVHACAHVFAYIHKHMVCLEAQLDGVQHAPQSSTRNRHVGLAWVQEWTELQDTAQNLRLRSRPWVRALGVIPSSPALHCLQISCCRLKTRKSQGEHLE